jgi:hypothetical protein
MASEILEARLVTASQIGDFFDTLLFRKPEQALTP